MNAAGRLLSIHTHFQSSARDTVGVLWQRYLENGATEEDAIAAAQAALGEVKAVQSKLIEIGLEPTLFVETAEQLRIGLTPIRFGHVWNTIHSEKAAVEVHRTLLWSRWALSRFDEQDVDEDSLAGLLESLAAQETLLQQTSLPSSLRAMLERQVSDIKGALLLYKVSGVAPLTDAIHRHTNELRYPDSDLIKAAESSPEATSAVRKAFAMFNSAAKVADSGSKIIKFGSDMFELGTSAARFGQLLLPPGV